MQPGRELIQRILQRGISSGEFRPLNLDYAVFSVVAPMIFLIMWKHSMGPCATDVQIDPHAYIGNQIDVILHGVLTGTPPSSPTSRKAP